jgi:hypothetical protein
MSIRRRRSGTDRQVIEAKQNSRRAAGYEKEIEGIGYKRELKWSRRARVRARAREGKARVRTRTRPRVRVRAQAQRDS